MLKNEKQAKLKVKDPFMARSLTSKPFTKFERTISRPSSTSPDLRFADGSASVLIDLTQRVSFLKNDEVDCNITEEP